MLSEVSLTHNPVINMATLRSYLSNSAQSVSVVVELTNRQRLGIYVN